MQSDYYINLHFNQAVAQKTGYAFKIGDKGCTFHFHCEDLDPSNMYPHIVFNHPNNTCVEGVPTGSGRDYAYTIAGNEFGVCGKTVVDLKFYDNNNDATQRISTASFMIEIIADTYTDFEESSSSYADSLERAREEIDAAILELQGAEHDLEEAEGDLDDMSEEFANTLQDYIDAFGNTAPINPRGAYVAATEYHPRDAVEYTAGGKTLTYINRSACTGIAPTDPDHGAEHWQIMIDVSVGGSFSALSDVSVDPQTLADGQVPVYDATGQVWENKTILENSLTSTATNKALTAAQGKDLQDNKQPKELETPITVAGTSQTTVETALGGLNAYSDKLKANLSNRNLIDNPWFTVNQRNATGGTIVSYTPIVDRWKVDKGSGSPTWSLDANGLTLTPDTNSYAYIYQPLENGTNLNGKVVTISVKLSDGTITSATFTRTSGTNQSDTQNDITMRFNSDEAIRIYAQNGAEKTIRAVKLELGSVSTLHLDVAPNYTTELLKCQRYFERVKLLGVGNSQSVIGIGYASTATTVRMTIPAKGKRAAPTITYSGSFTLHDGSAVSAISFEEMTDNGVVVNVTSSGLTSGNIYLLRVGNTSYYIDIASDL